jgi:hypothetical protein
MSVRQAVADFVKLGPLPDDDASEETITKHHLALEHIKRPVTDEEAELLVKCFGPDDCYGLAWTLLHLIETAPGGIPIKEPPSEKDNEWLRRLWSGSHRQ